MPRHNCPMYKDFVITDDGRTAAHAVGANVALGAGAAIVARAGQSGVLASASYAIVVGARQLIVAHAVAGLVGDAVAVVIFQIAFFGKRALRVASAQARCATSALARATSRRIDVAASGRQGQFGRPRVASAGQIVLDALRALDTADTGAVLATVTA